MNTQSINRFPTPTGSARPKFIQVGSKDNMATRAQADGVSLRREQASVVFPDGSGLYNVNGMTRSALPGTAFVPDPNVGVLSSVLKDLPELGTEEIKQRLDSAPAPRTSLTPHAFTPVTTNPNGTLTSLS